MTDILTQPFDPDFSDLKVLSSAKFQTFQAFDTRNNLPVVLKVFPNTPTTSLKYYNEKSHLLSLNHPHVVRLIQAVDTAPIPTETEWNSVSYLVLEYAAHGDFYDVVKKNNRMSEILARTFFHQLIEAISYLHSQNVAHLDLKMENLLLNQDYTLKIADFDLSQSLDEDELEGQGTVDYRAPEVKEGRCEDFIAADLYSVGVILFALFAGTVPYCETAYSNDGSGYDDYYRLFKTKNALFWKKHSRSLMDLDYFSESFRELINRMLAEDPKNRPRVEDIKEMKWYNGEILEGEAYIAAIEEYMNKI